jgi:hypothetical protein
MAPLVRFTYVAYKSVRQNLMRQQTSLLPISDLTSFALALQESGVGRENGLAALLGYSQARSVVVRMDDAPFDWFVADKNVRYS